MLTSKVGETIINCFDSKYDRYRLKQWSNKGILKCPVCDGDYEYCHGEIVSPYFRHVGKECNGYYSESETEEHKQGKMMLYEWIKGQTGVINCTLEAWIPETKQRPDIYFEYNGNRYVIEFQCTPIASEFLLRRELYRLAGIKDIWILGTEKYSIKINEFGEPVHENRYKKIEKELESEGSVYFDVRRKVLICNSVLIKMDKDLKKLIRFHESNSKMRGFDLFDNYGRYGNFRFIEFLDNFSFGDSGIQPNEEIMSLISEVKYYYFKEYETVKQEEVRRKVRLEEMKEKLKNVEETSSYIGRIGESITLNLLLIEERFFWSYGSTLHKFADENGNIVTWLTTKTPNVKIGDLVRLKGTVKSHSEYENIKQTRLVRCELE